MCRLTEFLFVMQIFDNACLGILVNYCSFKEIHFPYLFTIFFMRLRVKNRQPVSQTITKYVSCIL